ncbi:major facilitator superfamily domain-containing protein [Fennellomyces sp. T-0311]|nr:major facilitator superfamily domain-containing protein [Fennellomyces sp. T-0311]
MTSDIEESTPHVGDGSESKSKERHKSPCSSITEDRVVADDDQKPDTTPYPKDTGYAWLIVFAMFLITLEILTMPFGWGVLQGYYQFNVFGSSQDVILRLTFVGTILQMVMNVALIASRFLELAVGIKRSIIIGTALTVGGLIAASESTQIWQLYLSISVCYGLGNGPLNSLSLRLIPQWFDEKRSRASAISFSGSVLGGIVAPLFFTAITSSLGPQWTYRIVAIIFLVFNIIIGCIVRENIPTTSAKKKCSSYAIDFSLLKNTSFVIWIIACLPQVFVQLIPYIIVPVYASYIGLSPVQGTVCVSVISAVNCVGRLIAGVVADKIGNMNTLVIYNTLGAFASLFIWMFAYNYTTLLLFSATYGLFGTVYFVLSPPTTARIVGVEKLPSANIFLCLSTAPMSFGTSIASAIETASTTQPFLIYKLLLGLPLLISTIIIVILKLKMTGNLFSKI